MDNDRIWNLIAKKLAGEASAGDLYELETALRLNPELHYSLEAMHEMWRNHPEQVTEKADTAYQKHLERMHSLGMDIRTADQSDETDMFESQRIFFNYRTKGLIIVCSMLLFVLGIYYVNTRIVSTAPSSKQLLEVVTRNGTKTNILLPDGTTVWLNAGSRLSYDSLYGNTLREVNLSGEAYFDVVKNPDKPFIIHTGKINIRVLGTIFNVKSYPGEKTIETSLIKGSIEVSFPSTSAKKIILKPNQKLVINKTENNPTVTLNQMNASPSPQISIQPISRVGTDSVIAETGWVENRLYFKDISFHELMKSMERKYGISFQLTDISLDTVHFTGSFQNETVSQALDALRLTAEKSTTDFTYEIQGNQVIIYKNAADLQSNQPK